MNKITSQNHRVNLSWINHLVQGAKVVFWLVPCAPAGQTEELAPVLNLRQLPTPAELLPCRVDRLLAARFILILTLIGPIIRQPQALQGDLPQVLLVRLQSLPETR